MFSILVTVIGLAVALLLAVFADRVVRGAKVYKTLLIWPYAVAAAVAAVLWLFLLNPTLGILTHLLRALGYDWNYLLNAAPGADPDRHHRGVEADQLQLPVLPGRPAIGARSR